MSVLIRSFLAIELPANIQKHLGGLGLSFPGGKNLPVRWVAPSHIHLTLKFLGESERSTLMQLEENLMPWLAGVQPFHITLSGIGAFPSNQRPRVIWVGVQAPPILAEMAQKIEQQARILGYEPEERAFSPHLTLGRVANSVQAQDLLGIRQGLEGAPLITPEKIQINSITLMKSVLTPNGPVYSPLAVMGFSC